MKWFWQRDDSPDKAARDLSLDAYADQFLNVGGHTYPSNFGGAGWEFGGFTGPDTGSKSDEERASDDFEAMAGAIYKASAAVFAVHNYRRALFSEARLCFQKLGDDGRPGDLTDSPALDILRKPWNGATTRDLLTKAIMYADLGGNAFMIRDVINGQDQIKFLRPDWTMILMSGDPKQLADVEKIALIYKPGNTANPKKWVVYPFDGSNGHVAHWAPVPDPQASFRGMSWLDPIIKEAQTDKAMATTKLRYFQNGARPGIIASFDASIEPEDAAAFQELFNKTKVGAENMYKTMFIGGGCSIDQFKMELDDFEKISAVGELRIAAVGQVPPTLVGLTESMKGSALNEGNFQAAKDAFGDGTMRPLWGSFCDAIASLLDVPDGQRSWYDDRDISFLREDQKEVADIKAQEAQIVAKLIQEGFKPDACVKFARSGDLRELLEQHTGLYSVQLSPPGLGTMPGYSGTMPNTPTPGAKPASQPGRPPTQQPTSKPQNQGNKTQKDGK